MTATQRERLLGMMLLGASSSTACAVLSIESSDLLAELDVDPAFRLGYLGASEQRDAVTRALAGG